MLKSKMTYGGIYVHIPFCRRKCVYCDFYSLPLKDWNTERFVQTLVQEINVKAACYPLKATTLYIGGGTPTVLNCDQLCQIIEHVRKQFGLLPSAEITIEANPGTITKNMAKALHQAGVNRISLGVQAMQDHILKQLGRIHSREDVLRSIDDLQSIGIKNINTDLMCGLPNQSLGDLQTSIQAMCDTGVTHISLYPLQLEQDTLLYQQVKQGQVILPEDDLTLQMMQLATEELLKQGFAHYEIANYAQPGFESKHNLTYWHNETYLGLGPAAASYYQQRRWLNVPDINSYLTSLGKPKTALDEASLREEIAMAETVFLGLRLLQEGLCRQRFWQRFGKTLDEVYQLQLLELKSKGWIEDDGQCIRLTAESLPIANQVFVAFL